MVLAAKKAELQALGSSIEEVMCLQKQVQKDRTDAWDFVAALQSLAVLTTEITAIRDQAGNLMLPSGCDACCCDASLMNPLLAHLLNVIYVYFVLKQKLD